MPFKDKEKRLAAQRAAMQKKRQGFTQGFTEDGETLETVIPEGSDVIPDVIPSTQQDAGWAHVIEFIKREPRKGDIPNLLKLQRIAGCLGKYGQDVWFGNLDMATIGKIIGTAEEGKRPAGPPVRV